MRFLSFVLKVTDVMFAFQAMLNTMTLRSEAVRKVSTSKLKASEEVMTSAELLDFNFSTVATLSIFQYLYLKAEKLHFLKFMIQCWNFYAEE